MNTRSAMTDESMHAIVMHMLKNNIDVACLQETRRRFTDGIEETSLPGGFTFFGENGDPKYSGVGIQVQDSPIATDHRMLFADMRAIVDNCKPSKLWSRWKSLLK